MPAYTWATGETITATKLNALETEAWRVANQIAEGFSTSASTTTSTSFVDAAASVTFTAKSTSVYVQVFGGGTSYPTTTSTGGIIGVNINGTDYTVCTFANINSNFKGTYCGGVLVTGLTSGNSYTAKIRIRTTSATDQIGINSLTGSVAGRQTIAVWDISK